MRSTERIDLSSVAMHILGHWPAVIKEGWTEGPEPHSLDYNYKLTMAS
jgi:hypothetical protein